jgi:hypothetical protein
LTGRKKELGFTPDFAREGYAKSCAKWLTKMKMKNGVGIAKSG